MYEKKIRVLILVPFENESIGFILVFILSPILNPSTFHNPFCFAFLCWFVIDESLSLDKRI